MSTILTPILTSNHNNQSWQPTLTTNLNTNLDSKSLSNLTNITHSLYNMDPSLQLVTQQKILSLAREKVDQGKGWLQLGWGKEQLQLGREGKEDCILLKPHLWWCAFDIYFARCAVFLPPPVWGCGPVWPLGLWESLWLGDGHRWAVLYPGSRLSHTRPLEHAHTQQT